MKKYKMQIVVALALGGALILGQGSAKAQLGGFGKKKSDAGGGGATVNLDAFGKSSQDAADNVLAARLAFLDSKMKMMDALGLKTEAVAKASESLRAKEGSSSKPGEKVEACKTSSKATAEADKAMEAALTESKELSAEAKAKFAEGSGKFIEGLLLEKEQIQTIQKLAEQGQSLVQSASPMEKPKVLGVVKPITDLATIVPGDVKEGTGTLGKILKFAKKQSITNIPGEDKVADKLGTL